MRMSTTRLILLRLYLLTFGRMELFSRLLRRVMVWLLIERPSQLHVPSSRFFTPDQLRESNK